jgi:cellulose synthase operon protein C
VRRFSHSLARVRLGRRLTLGLGELALLWGLITADAYAQFNARGRSPAPSAPPKTEKQAAQNKKPASEPLERDDVLIDRYEKLILAEPGEDVPLTRLAELVRKRDGNLNTLLKKLEARASSGENKYAVLVAWGGILSKDGQVEAASVRLQEAVTLNPHRPQAWLLLGTLQRALGRRNEALQSLKNALPHLHGPERSMLVRDLRDLCLESNDYECAAQHHKTLTQESSGNLFLQGELGRELLKRGQTERAIEELSRVARQAAGDARALAPALKDLGEAQLEGGKIKDAIGNLKKASQLAATTPGLRVAIDTLRAEAHRKDGSLPLLLDELEASTSSAPRLGLLGQLHEEQGNTDKAAETYEKALRLDPNNLDLRLRLVRLYEISGDIDGAANEYGRLVKASPRDVQLSLRFAEMLLAQGKRDRAVTELDRIDRISASDPEASLLILDFAERLEETDRKKRILSRLSQLKSRDTQFIVELGSRYYQSGDTDAAHRTWKKILDVGTDRARAHLTYGEVLIDHEKPTEGVAELRKAAELEPADLRVKKALALGLERASSQAPPATRQSLEQQALKVWTDLLRSPPHSSDPTLNQTKNLARRHVVRIWKRTGRLAEALPALEKELTRTPPDLESGRLLAEAYLATRADRQAIATLKLILKHAAGDVPTLLLLESAHTKAGDYEETINTLEKLVEADPRRAREYYDRMARAAAQKNDHKNALRYAELSVQKSPSDPLAQVSLGDLYATQGRLKEAESAYRRALAQDDRLHPVSLKLADILTKTGRTSEGLDTLFHVMRSARDLDAVGTSARRAFALAIPLKREREVEEVLRPLAISYPDQSLYRTLLLEVLSSQMYSLSLSSEHGPVADREAARSALKELSDRSTGPLLAALAARNAGEQQMAISLLAHGSTKTAGSGLLAFAEGSAPEEQRLLAILALGNSDTKDFDDRLRNLVSPEGTLRRGRIPRAAAWVFSRGSSPEAAPALLSALSDGDLELRSYAALGLADLKTPSLTRAKIIQELSSTVEGATHGGIARSAAALALGKLATQGTLKEHDRQALEQTLQSALATGSTLLQRSALLSLARVSKGPLARERVAQGLLSADDELRETATFAAALFTLGNNAAPLDPLLPARLSPAEMDAEDRVKAALEASRTGITAQSRHAALLLLEQDLIDHAKVSLRSSAQEAGAVLRQFRPDGRRVLFGQLLTPEDLQSPSVLLPQALEASTRLRAALTDDIISLASGPHPELAEQALRTLRTGDRGAALSVLEQQLRNPNTGMHAAALEAVTNSANVEAIALLQRYLKEEDSWGRRRRAVSALGKLIQEGQPPAVIEQARALLQSLRRDPSELVRREVSAVLNRSSNGAQLKNDAP